MPHAVVLQPNGLYAIWSSIVDNFLHLNMTQDEVIRTWTSDALLSPDRNNAIIMAGKQLVNIENTGTAWDWSPDWNDCISWLREHQPEMISEIEAEGIPLEMERKHTELEKEKYWRFYWRNRCLALEAELSEYRHRA